MPLQIVTRERLADRSHYRLQMNTDNRIVAYLYNCLVLYYGVKRVATVRNKISVAAGNVIIGMFNEAVAKDLVFAEYVRETYLKTWVDDEIRPEAEVYYGKNGLVFP